MRRLAIDARQPDTMALEEAAALILAGEIVAVPTDTLYGLAADPFSTDAVARVFAAKGRGAERALALIAADIAQIEDRLGPLSPEARRLAWKTLLQARAIERRACRSSAVKTGNWQKSTDPVART